MEELEEYSKKEMLRGGVQLALVRASKEGLKFDLKGVSPTKLAAEIRMLYYLHPLGQNGATIFSKVIDFSNLEFGSDDEMQDKIEFWLAFSEIESTPKIDEIKIVPLIIWKEFGITLYNGNFSKYFSEINFN